MSSAGARECIVTIDLTMKDMRGFCKMKPYPIQRLLANDWFFVTAFLGIAISVGLFVSMDVYGEDGFFVSIMTGATCGFLLSYFPLLILAYIVSKLNGAPFRKGDIVQILVREHAGKTVTVYEEWKDRKQVRVDLGERAKNELKDIFSFIEIRRIKSESKD